MLLSNGVILWNPTYAPTPDQAVIKRLREVNLDNLTPKNALDVMYELKAMV
ncbi:hypothetical protein FACS1894126_6320 [Alphaproteobacteria bacterium]|nr:hypothetical protein FACS1894126_6320 [Alphaproteobacteria bacterium]